MLTHTPGPWRKTGPNIRAGDALVAVVKNAWADADTPEHEKEANARLIAAAPSLADAALRALIHLSDPEPDENEGDRIVLLLCDALRMAGRLNKNLED